MPPLSKHEGSSASVTAQEVGQIYEAMESRIAEKVRAVFREEMAALREEIAIHAERVRRLEDARNRELGARAAIGAVAGLIGAALTAFFEWAQHKSP